MRIKTNWYWFKELVANALLIGWGILSVHLFINILIKGRVYIYEANDIILWAEVIVPCLVILLGFDRFIDDWKRLVKGRNG